MNFKIYDPNNNPIGIISGINDNKDFGLFFDDSYSYKIDFPLDATPDLKLTLLHCIYSLENGIILDMTIQSIDHKNDTTIIKAIGFVSDYMQPENRHLEITYKKSYKPYVFIPHITEADIDFFHHSARFAPFFDFLEMRKHLMVEETKKLIPDLFRNYLQME